MDDRKVNKIVKEVFLKVKGKVIHSWYLNRSASLKLVKRGYKDYRRLVSRSSNKERWKEWMTRASFIIITQRNEVTKGNWSRSPKEPCLLYQIVKTRDNDKDYRFSILYSKRPFFCLVVMSFILLPIESCLQVQRSYILRESHSAYRLTDSFQRGCFEGRCLFVAALISWLIVAAVDNVKSKYIKEKKRDLRTCYGLCIMLTKRSLDLW